MRFKSLQLLKLFFCFRFRFVTKHKNKGRDKMKKAELLQMLKQAKENPEILDSAITKLGATRGIQFEVVENDTELAEGFWYTVQDGNLVSVPSTKTMNDGRIAEFVPYYRTKD